MWLIELTHWIHRRAAETAATRIGKEITRLSVTTIPALSARFGVEGENAVAGLRSLRRARSRGSDSRERNAVLDGRGTDLPRSSSGPSRPKLFSSKCNGLLRNPFRFVKSARSEELPAGEFSD
jgi:hypothetical protein